jgi:hypothetical protein
VDYNTFFYCLEFAPPVMIILPISSVSKCVHSKEALYMGLRYEEATPMVLDMLKELKAKDFSELKNAKIKVLFDLKKRKSGGQIILGKIMKTNDLIRLLTKDEVEVIEGYDYIITLDKKCWDNIPDDDRVRILRHELRHTHFDIESENDPYKLVSHSISDFYEEVEANQKDPRWRERVGTLAEDIYEQEKEAQAEKKTKKKPKGGL